MDPVEKSMICICCPQGCHLSVVGDEKSGIAVSGNRCPRGDAYARQEILNPCRVVTAVVSTDSSVFPCLAVRTDAALPKNLIAGLLDRLYAMRVVLPVAMGDVVIRNFAGSGINVIAGETLESD